MKKICLNCNFCDVSFPDTDIRELKPEDDYLVCYLTKEKVDDYQKCGKYVPSKTREADIKAGC